MFPRTSVAFNYSFNLDGVLISSFFCPETPPNPPRGMGRAREGFVRNIEDSIYLEIIDYFSLNLYL